MDVFGQLGMLCCPKFMHVFTQEVALTQDSGRLASKLTSDPSMQLQFCKFARPCSMELQCEHQLPVPACWHTPPVFPLFQAFS
jgi:hypothetical protein